MKNYIIDEQKGCKKYPFIIFSISYISPLEEIDLIEKELKCRYKGKILFDLLLSNGISTNRYLEAEFNGENFILSSFKPLIQVDYTIKERAAIFYREHAEYLKNSVLPNAYRFLIKKGRIL
ncbi:type II toxin-antitoxin system RnlB family antitoxin [Parageobacillus toebii]|uniref:type II toxin-antitoxin system RnlB family antitoxin n=1 Tax=Parageobacillus toebii TaxID=153151 RepID=UPI002E2221DB|nr:type II toxin-antitoxin system RnlB family antitoxin [Parageobacillus toebii]